MTLAMSRCELPPTKQVLLPRSPAVGLRPAQAASPGSNDAQGIAHRPVPRLRSPANRWNRSNSFRTGS